MVRVTGRWARPWLDLLADPMLARVLTFAIPIAFVALSAVRAVGFPKRPNRKPVSKTGKFTSATPVKSCTVAG